PSTMMSPSSLGSSDFSDYLRAINGSANATRPLFTSTTKTWTQRPGTASQFCPAATNASSKKCAQKSWASATLRPWMAPLTDTDHAVRRADLVRCRWPTALFQHFIEHLQDLVVAGQLRAALSAL